MTNQLTVAARPTSLDAMSGHGTQLGVLKRDVLAGEWRHLILGGESGTGKSTTARVLAKAIFCRASLKSGSSCNSCAICQAFEKGELIDFHWVDCQHHGGKADIEFLLDEEIRGRPMVAKVHVVVFDEFDGSTLPAQSLLLGALQRSGVPWCFIFTCVDPESLILPLRDRCRILRLDVPNHEQSVAYLEGLAARHSLRVDSEALSLIAAYGRGYRQLCEMLDTASALAGDGAVTTSLVRQNLLRDRSVLILDYLAQTARGDLPGQLEALSRIQLSPPELVRALRDVLMHLTVRLNQKGRANTRYDRLSLLLADDDCEDVTRALAARAEELSQTVEQLLDAMLGFLLDLDIHIDGQQLRGSAIRLHHRLQAGAPASIRAFASQSDRAPATPSSARRIAGPPSWLKTAASDRRGTFLTLAQAPDIYEASTAAVQLYNRPINAILTVRHALLGNQTESAAVDCASTLLKELRARIVKRRASLTDDLHRISLLERGVDGFITTVIFHLPPSTRRRVEQWLQSCWLPNVAPPGLLVPAFDFSTTDAKSRRGEMKVHWDLVRRLWGGISPDIVFDGEPLLDLLQVSEGDRRQLGSIDGNRFNLSQSISLKARQSAAIERMPLLSPWSDRAWAWLFRGWEIKEYQSRQMELECRRKRLDELHRSYAGDSGDLGHIALNAEIKKLMDSMPYSPYDRPREWEGWWKP